MHQRAKFRHNRLIGCEDIKIFSFFSRWGLPPSWIFKFVKFYWLTVSGGPRRITVPNFVKIGRSFVKILRFFEFSKWQSPPSLIFEITKFYWLLGWRVSGHTSMPNVVKIGQSIGQSEYIKIFRFFKMAAVRQLGFVWGIFGLPTVSTWESVSLCKIWL